MPSVADDLEDTVGEESGGEDGGEVGEELGDGEGGEEEEEQEGDVEEGEAKEGDAEEEQEGEEQQISEGSGGEEKEEGQNREGAEEEEREIDEEVALKDELGDYIHTRTEKEEQESLQDVFSYLTEGRARISPADIINAVARMGVKVSKILLQEVILEATGGSSANLTPDEFVTMMQKFGEKDLHDELKEIWVLAGGETPVNDLARMSQASLAKALHDLGADMSDTEVASLIAFVGGEENELDYEQFVRLLAPYR